MNHRRWTHDSIVLPNGHVLVVGGEEAGESHGAGGNAVPVYLAEWIDLDADPIQWQELAEATEPRIYHSVALLLPDGRVLTAGGRNPYPSEDPCEWPCACTCGTPNCPHPDCCPPGECQSAGVVSSGEIFEPPYLFAPDGSPAPRPIIKSAPDRVIYDASFCIALDEGDVTAEDITQVNLIRTGAVTHGFDQNQRFMPLVDDPQFEIEVDATYNRITVTSPANANIAPPGYYMLFLISSDGVPSEATFIQLQHECPPCPDVTGDGSVGIDDILELLDQWGDCPSEPCHDCECTADLNGDGVVDMLDLLILLNSWGPCVTCAVQCPPQSVEECWELYHDNMDRYEACIEAVNSQGGGSIE